jgi:hypothetical protein
MVKEIRPQTGLLFEPLDDEWEAVRVDCDWLLFWLEYHLEYLSKIVPAIEAHEKFQSEFRAMQGRFYGEDGGAPDKSDYFDDLRELVTNLRSGNMEDKRAHLVSNWRSIAEKLGLSADSEAPSLSTLYRIMKR